MINGVIAVRPGATVRAEETAMRTTVAAAAPAGR